LAGAVGSLKKKALLPITAMRVIRFGFGRALNRKGQLFG